jgi:hypothetical protein
MGAEANCGTKSNEKSDGVRDQTEWENKFSGRPNGSRNKIERGMSPGGRCGGSVIAQTRSSERGNVQRMTVGFTLGMVNMTVNPPID